MRRNTTWLRLFVAGFLAFAALSGPFQRQGFAQTSLVPQSPTPLPGQTDKRFRWIFATEDERHDLAEQIGQEGARAYCKAQGWKKVLGHGGNRPGPDQVWYDPKRDLIITIEAKGGNSPVARGQKGIDWVIREAEAIVASIDRDPAERRAAREILEHAAEGRLWHLVVRTKHVNGTPRTPEVENLAMATRAQQLRARAALVRVRPLLDEKTAASTLPRNKGGQGSAGWLPTQTEQKDHVLRRILRRAFNAADESRGTPPQPDERPEATQGATQERRNFGRNSHVMKSPTWLPAQTDRRSQWICATVDERKLLAEQIGEEGAHAYCKAQGWEQVLGPGGYRRGYDQVWYDPEGDLIITVEAKGGSSPVHPHQKKIDWVIKNAEDIAGSPYRSPAERRAAGEVLEYAARGRLRHIVIRTKHVLGTPSVPEVEHVATPTGIQQRQAGSALARVRPALREFFSYFSRSEQATEAAARTSRAAGYSVSKAGRVIGTIADEEAEAAAAAYRATGRAGRAAAYGRVAAGYADEALETASGTARAVGRAAEVAESLAGRVAVGIEVAVVGYEVYQREKAYREGRISRSERWRGHVGQLTGTAGGVGGAIYGAAAGAAVGGPVGAFIGAGVGAFAGSEAGRWVGRKAYDLWRSLRW